jgi:hypothetical protein
MRTTISRRSMDEAQSLLGYKSKTDTIIFSLRELLRKENINQLKKLAGKIELNIDIDKSRRRPKEKKK